MPFYIEYTANQHADIRSSVDSNDRGQALVRAADAAREAGFRTALLRFTAEASTSFGDGDVVARYTESGGWETV